MNSHIIPNKDTVIFTYNDKPYSISRASTYGFQKIKEAVLDKNYKKAAAIADRKYEYKETIQLYVSPDAAFLKMFSPSSSDTELITLQGEGWLSTSIASNSLEAVYPSLEDFYDDYPEYGI